MARDRDVASSTHANKGTLSASNSSRDLRVERWRGWPSQAFGMVPGISRLFQIEADLQPPTFSLFELLFDSLVMKAVHKSYLDYLRPSGS